MKKLALTDFLKYRYPSALELSPDGRYLAFALKETDREGDGYRWNLWLCDLESGESRQITRGDAQKQAVWEDDTHVLYKTTELDEALRTRGLEEEWTVYRRLDVRTGEESEAFRLPMSVTGIWRMDAGRYIFTAETHLDRPNLLELAGEAREGEIARRLRTKGYKVLTELPLCENGVGMYNQTRNTLFLYLEATGEYRRLTPDDYDVNHVNVRPGQVLFTAFPFRDVKPVTEGMYRWDADRDETVTLIPPDKYSIDYVGYLGRKALCLGLVMRDYGVYEHPTFFVVDKEGEEDLGRYDRRVNSEVVTDCFSGSTTGQRMVGETLYFLNTDGVGSCLCAWERETGVQPLFGGDDYLIPEVYRWSGGELEQLTSFNGDVLEGVTLSAPERLTFTDSDGVDIDGFVMKPVGYEPGKRYPGILHIHGGPKMVFGPGFHHEMQLWAASGYFVYYCNPRGSCGKGNAFADLQGRYGDVDFRDLMEFTDEVLRRYPDLDAGRMGVAGGSYGGFMTNWVIGHTDRFRCAVSQRSIANYVGDYLLSDIGYYYVPDQQLGTIWDHPERLWKASPLTYADRVKTPTLFIHADKDYRCTLANGLEMFAALKLHGVESKLCMFYGENHGLSREGKPSNRISRLSEILGWMEEHLKTE